MTRYFISPVLLAMITVACSSSTTTQSGCTTQECIDQLDGTGGGTSASTSTSAAGSTSVIGTTGGSGTIGTTGPVTTGGNSTATTNTTSVAGSPSTGGNGTGTTGGSSTTSTCVPKTCDQIAPAWSSTSCSSCTSSGCCLLTKPTVCGIASDGCGSTISCGTCTTDGTPNTDCGQAPATLVDSTGTLLFDFAAHGLKATANICGTRCVNDLSGSGAVVCTSSIPPLGLNNCKSINAAQHTWSCSST